MIPNNTNRPARVVAMMMMPMTNIMLMMTMMIMMVMMVMTMMMIVMICSERSNLMQMVLARGRRSKKTESKQNADDRVFCDFHSTVVDCQ